MGNVKIIYNVETGETTYEEYEELPRDISFCRTEKMNEMQDYYKQKLEAGFVCSINGKQIMFGYSQQDQLTYSKIATLFSLQKDKTSTVIGTISHGMILLTKDQYLTFMSVAENHELGMYVAKKQYEKLIEDAANQEELEKIIIDFENLTI